MHTLTILRINHPQNPRNRRPPISALSNILIVPQRQHELIKRVCDFPDIEALLRGIGGKCESGDRRRDDMECLLPFWRVCQWSEDFTDFVEVAWPSVNKDEGNGVFVGGRLVDKVDF